MDKHGFFIDVTFEDGRTLCLDAKGGSFRLVTHAFKMRDGQSIDHVSLGDLITVTGAREIAPEAMPKDTEETLDTDSPKEALRRSEKRRLEMFPELKGKE